MFGLFRFILAVIVVGHHIGGLPGYPAHYAVWGFYVLSGFLMTLIVKEKYGFTFKGQYAYLVNRFLRIYPTYWLSISLTVILLLLWGNDFVSSFRNSMRLPADLGSILKNIFIFGLRPDSSLVRLTPPSWALAIELIYYLLIGLVSSRSFKLTVCWAVAALAVNLFMIFNGRNPYDNVIACSLPFSMGSLTYFLNDKIKNLPIRLHYLKLQAIFISIFLIIVLVVFFGHPNPHGFILLLMSIFFCVITSLGFNVIKPLKTSTIAFLDKLLGDLSYPVYLFHWQTGVLLGYLFHLKIGLKLLCVTFPVTILVSYLIIVFFEPSVNELRSRIKKRRGVNV